MSHPTLRDYIANMVYVGILAQMLGIDMEKIKQALDFHFKGKAQAIDSNFRRDQGWRRVGRAKPEKDRSLFRRTDGCHFKAISWQMAIPLRPWVPFMAAFSLPPGIRSRRPPPWLNRSMFICPNCAKPRTANRPMPSSRPKMNSLPSAWPSVPAGAACAR